MNGGDYEPEPWLRRFMEGWYRAAIEDIENFTGPCKIDRVISYGTVSAVHEAVLKEIERREAIRPKNRFQQKVLRELKEYRVALEAAMKEGQRRYAATSPRPWPFKPGSGIDEEWMRLKEEEAEASPRRRRGKRT